jgi:hypothetical protein
LEAIGIGSIVAEVIVGGKINKNRINECLHVPNKHVNLCSVSKLVSSGLKVQFNINECIIRAFDGHPVAIAPREGNLYHFHVVKVHRMERPTWCNLMEETEVSNFGTAASVI